MYASRLGVCGDDLIADNVGDDCPVFDGLFEYCSISAGGSMGMQNVLTKQRVLRVCRETSAILPSTGQEGYTMQRRARPAGSATSMILC